jgi:transposase-like protein
VLHGEYPQTLLDFDESFPDEEACRQYLARLRWPDGYKCETCGSPEAWLTSRGLMHCKMCGHQASVTAGTIFHRTRTPLRLWFHAIWWLTSQKNGASALNLQRILGLGTYKTAWTWLHKLRRAMVRPGRDRLADEVEVDETIIGGVEEGGGGRHLGPRKALVAIAAEAKGQRAIGRIRLEVVDDSSAGSLLPFVEHTIEPGALVITDGLPSYNSLKQRGYGHKVLIARQSQDAHRLLPRVHRVASLLKRWLLGTHQGSVERQHLPYYLDEFTFRFNRRTSNHRGLLFYRLLQQAVDIEPTTYAGIVGGRRPQYMDPT